jgi:hypothetical protein
MALKVYLIAGEGFIAICLCRGGRLAHELRKTESFVEAVGAVIVLVATWPMAFVLGAMGKLR